jgi:hypothetical protein
MEKALNVSVVVMALRVSVLRAQAGSSEVMGLWFTSTLMCRTGGSCFCSSSDEQAVNRPAVRATV